MGSYPVSLHYHKKRLGTQVFSIYVGSETKQTLDFDFNIERLNEPLLEAQSIDCIEKEDSDEAECIKIFMDYTRSIYNATLIAAGYHTHKGQWRKKRIASKKETRNIR